jgi:hypothetical protein
MMRTVCGHGVSQQSQRTTIRTCFANGVCVEGAPLSVACRGVRGESNTRQQGATRLCVERVVQPQRNCIARPQPAKLKHVQH